MHDIVRQLMHYNFMGQPPGWCKRDTHKEGEEGREREGRHEDGDKAELENCNREDNSHGNHDI